MIENLFPNVDWTKMWEATLETHLYDGNFNILHIRYWTCTWGFTIPFRTWSTMVE